MKAIVAILMLVGLTSQSQGFVPNSCTQRFLKVSNWDKVLNSVSECLKKSDDFNNGMSLLCTPDRTQFSDAYLAFIKYKMAYDDALAALQSMRSPTVVARYKVQRTKEDWEILGNRSQILTTIQHMNTGYHMCGG